MRYEYVLYKPPSLWPDLGNIKMQGLSFRKAVEECTRLRSAIEKRGIPTDLTNELLLIADLAGYSGKEGLERFKKETSIDLVSSDYRNISKITKEVNKFNERFGRKRAVI